MLGETMSKRCLCAMFSVALLSALVPVLAGQADAQEAEAIIEVNLDREQGTVTDRIYGHNVIGCIWYSDDGGGIWNPYSLPCANGVQGCFEPEAVDLARDAGIKFLRFPGGMNSRSYDWATGVGPPGEREYVFGTNEFLLFAREVGAQPIFTVNPYDLDDYSMGSQASIDSAAQWVFHCNADSGEPPGVQPSAPLPYPVRYWEIGSRPWESFRDPTPARTVYPAATPKIYAQKFVEFSAAMKAVDPEILVGSVAYESIDETDLAKLLSAFAEMDDSIEYWPDFFTIEYYRPNFDSNYCNLYGEDLEALKASYLSATAAAPAQIVRKLERFLDALGTQWADFPDKAKSVRVALSEYNTGLHFADLVTNYPGTEPPECPFRYMRHSLGASLFTADLLMRLSNAGKRLLYANAWNFMDTTTEVTTDWHGSVNRYQGGFIPRPTYYVFKMIANDHRPDIVLSSKVYSMTRDSERVPKAQPAFSIATGPEETHVRIRVSRNPEVIPGESLCGPDDRNNPDPGTAIAGRMDIDRIRLVDETSWDEAYPNLLVNGDFEDGLNGWTLGEIPDHVTSEHACEEGNCFYRLEFEDTGENNPDCLTLVSQTVEVSPSSRYMFSADLRATGLSMKTRNLVCDGGFDLTSDPGDFNSGYWIEYDTTPAPAEVIQDDCHSEPNCVKVPFQENINYWHLMQRYMLDKDPDPRYADPDSFLVRSAIRTQGLRNVVMVEIQQRDYSDQRLCSAEPIGVYGDTDWQLQDRKFEILDYENTNSITVHLRRKRTGEETGGGYAVYDSIFLYRDPEEYVPRIEADICTDAECSEYRTLTLDSAIGTTNWRRRTLSGTPLLSALAGRSGQGLEILVLNRDLETETPVSIRLSGDEVADLQGFDVFVSEITGDEPLAHNEPVGFNPGGDWPVSYEEWIYLGTLEGDTLEVVFAPHSITALSVVPPEEPDDQEPAANTIWEPGLLEIE